jgi:hypothetical protein
MEATTWGHGWGCRHGDALSVPGRSSKPRLCARLVFEALRGSPDLGTASPSWVQGWLCARETDGAAWLQARPRECHAGQWWPAACPSPPCAAFAPR